MISGNLTNKVYFSEKLKTDVRFANTCVNLIRLLDKYAINYEFLKGTNDIWCRDYMPIQIDKGNYIQFRYEPSYLKNDLHLQSNPSAICKINGFSTLFSSINLDGGNVVNWKDRAIITDRVFEENPEFTNKSKLIFELEKLLEVEIIVIPQIKSDMTGHADGMVRFIDHNTLIGNARDKEYKYWKDGLNKILKKYGINYIDIPFLEHKEIKHPYHAIGCYVNYLEVENLIVLPIFETINNKDQEVYDTFKQVFPNRFIESINYNEVGFWGGLLNCTSWTIQA